MSSDKMEKMSVEKLKLDVSRLHAAENGCHVPASALESEMAFHGLLPHTPVKTTDDHLVEFSEAMRTVAKALRRVAEGKAAAQAEAAEWKRKYELERERTLQHKHEAKLTEGCCKDMKVALENLSNKFLAQNPSMEQSECCGNHGICSQEILRNGGAVNNSKSAHKMVGRKASFMLSWGCNGDKSGQHKHEVVSFEKGNITTAERSNKQILLKWESQPQNVLILTKPNSTSVRDLCTEMVRWCHSDLGTDGE